MIEYFDNRDADTLLIRLSSLKIHKFKKLYSHFKEIAITFFHYSFYTIQDRRDLIEIDLSGLGLGKDELPFFFEVL